MTRGYSSPLDYRTGIFWVLALPVLYFISRYNYNLFHGLVDGASIIIAACVFMIVWNERRIIDNDYYLYVGIAFLFFGLLDLLHVLGNKNMGVFPEHGNLGPALYIASRYVLSISLLIAPLFIHRKLNTTLMFAAYSLVTSFILLSIFYWQIFPDCIVEGVGLTPFKVVSDYIICLILLGAIGLLLINRRSFDSRVFWMIVSSIILSIATGAAFTLYADPFGIMNAVGHFLQIASFYLISLAIIETSLTKPQDVLYQKLRQSEEKLTEKVRQLDYANGELKQEIAERKRVDRAVREGEAFTRAVMDHLPVGVAVNSVDPNVEFAYMNDNFPRFYRTTRESLADPDSFWDSVYEDPAFRGEIKKRVLDDCASGDPDRMHWEDVPIARKGQETAFISARNTRVPGRPLMISTVWDVTERRRMEEEVRKSRDELEHRVRERTTELQHRNQELQNFTFVASHDLQEPLRKLQTFADLIVTKYSDSIGEQGRDYLRRMEETAQRMQSLLQSLLEYSRLTSKASPFSRVGLKGIVEAVLCDLELPIKEANASVEIGDLPEIEADADQMASLFQNLIGNALKFRRVGDPPRVRIRSSAYAGAGSPNGEWEILVEDNGIGFDERCLDQIFKPFQRLHGRTSPYEGTGMGLAISMKVVERHGGSITARSTPGQGSTFIVRLPRTAVTRD